MALVTAHRSANVLIASVAYMVTGLSGHSDLRLRVGGNGIADFSGNFPQVRFGTNTAPLVSGDAFGSSGTVGIVGVYDCFATQARLQRFRRNLARSRMRYRSRPF